VLAVATRTVSGTAAYSRASETDLTLHGFVTFADELLPGVADSIAALARDGVVVKIVTGDNEAVARHACCKAGLAPGRIVLGAEIECLDDSALAHVAEAESFFARISPGQKHRIIRALKARGHVVGFLGDGINDAPSLHGADVGISVAGAVDVAKEASDIILLERNLSVIHAGIVAGRRSFGNVLKYLLMGTSSNFGNMFSMAGAAVLLPFLPMLPMQILLNNFLYDLAQITIPSDSVDPTWIARPQRWDVKAIRNFMLAIGPLSSIYDFITFWILLEWFHFDERHFHAGWFVESLATQTLVLFVIRTAGRPWSNRPSTALTITTLGVVAIGLILPATSIGTTLGFAPLPLGFFAFLAVATATYLALVEVVKHSLMKRLFQAPA
jgi:Mg2+-importing ATPase